MVSTEETNRGTLTTWPHQDLPCVKVENWPPICSKGSGVLSLGLKNLKLNKTSTPVWHIVSIQ